MHSSEEEIAPAAPLPAEAPAKPRAPWKWLLRLLLGALVVWLLARGASQAPLEGIMRAPPLLLAGCIAAYWAGQLLSVRRWQILLNALAPEAEAGDKAARIGWRECVPWYAAGMFWNLWMPTGLGGDAARSLLSGRAARDGARGALSVVLDRMLGLASLLILAVVALLVDTLASAGQVSLAQSSSIHIARRMLLACAVAAVVCGALGWALARASSRSAQNTESVGASEPDRAQPKWKGKLASLLSALSRGGRWRSARVLGPVLGLSLCVQAIQIGINLALARAVGLPIEAGSMAWVAPVLALSSVVPLGIGGLGAREAGATALLGGAFARGDVLAWSLLWQAVVWLSSLLGAPAAWKLRHLNAPDSSRD
jgi:uncharacterized membrane protein YbhN (UPF0104 family)